MYVEDSDAFILILFEYKTLNRLGHLLEMYKNASVYLLEIISIQREL